jgi:hypothetical protein
MRTMTWLWTRSAALAACTLLGCANTDAGQAASADTTCDRACLIDVAHTTARGTRSLPPTARFTENGQVMAYASSWLARASQLDIHDEYADPEHGAVIAVGSGLDSDGRSSVFGLRLQLSAGKPNEAELIITHEGEVSVFPPATPLPRQAVFSELVPEAQRTSAARMIEIANAYFDGIERDSGAAVPVTDDCNRLENGVQTTDSQRFGSLRCNSLEVFDYIPEVRERRFPLRDETRGIVAGLVAFYIPGGDYPRVVDGMQTTRHYDPRSLFLMEAFKIVDGKIRLIEATMRNMPLGSSMGWPGDSRQ